MLQLGYMLFDADEHDYEPRDTFTRQIDCEMRCTFFVSHGAGHVREVMRETTRRLLEVPV